MRVNVAPLTLGLCVGVLVGMVLAPLSGADVRRLVLQGVQQASNILGMFSRPIEELAEDLSR